MTEPESHQLPESDTEATRIYASFQRGEISESLMIHKLMPLIKKICGSVSFNLGNKFVVGASEELMNDLQQEVMLLLITKVKEKYDPTQKDLGSYLYSVAANKCRSKYMEDNLHYRYDPSILLTEDSSSQMSDDLSYDPELENQTDRSRALDRARAAIELRNKRATENPDNPLNPITLQPLNPKAKQRNSTDESVPVTLKPRDMKAADIVLSPDALELKAILDQLYLNYSEASELLGVKKATLASYVYGRTILISQDVMQEARQLLHNRQDLIEEAHAFRTQSMLEIMTRWIEQLGLAESDYEDLANHLGVHMITMNRWLEGRKPTIVMYREHDRLVKRRINK